MRRRNVRTLTPDDRTRIEEGDVVVLLGTEENLAAAEMMKPHAQGVMTGCPTQA